MRMLKRQIKEQLDKVYQELQMNLENNYKDLAKESFKQAELLLNTLYEEGKIKGRAYEKYKQKLEEYRRGMIGYHH